MTSELREILSCEGIESTHTHKLCPHAKQQLQSLIGGCLPKQKRNYIDPGQTFAEKLEYRRGYNQALSDITANLKSKGLIK